LDLVKKYQIPFHEKKHGQLFCDDKAKDIVNMLLSECQKYGAQINLNETTGSVEQLQENFFQIKSDKHQYSCGSLVIATGGLSIPTMGATPFGYQIAAQFGIHVWPVRAGLVPLTLQPADKEKLSALSGISNECVVKCHKQHFTENILFTHRGLSGPAILQISNYWQPGMTLDINLLPHIDLLEIFKNVQKHHPKRSLKEFLAEFITKRIISVFLDPEMAAKPLQSISTSGFEAIATKFQQWLIKPNGTEGYRTAEVTLGGVDCDAISSKTMESKTVRGLYFIGEVLDVTGWLGGYNFQWAWSSGWAAGQVI
jgi:predicted Rossmann fold flavoprotein